MSGIVGIACFETGPPEQELLDAMLETLAHRGTDARGVWRGSTAGLGQNALWTTPESVKERQPLFSEDRSLVLVSDARIDNRRELIAALVLDGRAESEVTDAEVVLAAYQAWGEQCPARLIGDFAFAIWDGRRRQLFCARDPMGIRSFYYYHGNGRFAFASEIKALFRAPWIPREFNEIRIAEHLVSVIEDQASTFYRGIFRLPAAHSLTVTADGAHLRRYWALDPLRELRLGSDAEYEEAFRELFTEAVRCRLRSAYPVGSTLSGGLDSSSIACVARNCLREGGGRLHAFSAVFPSLPRQYLRSIDERSYMRTVLDQGGIESHEVFADLLNPIGDLEEMLWHQDDPLVPFNVYMHLGIYRAAREQGVRVMLDGFDGDTTISYGHERLPELFRTFHWGALLREVRSLRWRVFGGRLPLWRVLWAYALSPLIPAISRPHWRTDRGRRRQMPWGGDSPIAESLAARVGLDGHMLRLERGRNHRFVSARETHRQSLESPLIPYALDLADKAAAACAIEARYPFFDRRLVEFCLALPADQKLRGGHQRYILRRAMEGILPPEIQWRDSKGNLSPNFYLNLLSEGRETLDRILAEDLDTASPYMDPEAVRVLYSRYISQPSNTDAMTLFLATTFAAWVRGTKYSIIKSYS